LTASVIDANAVLSREEAIRVIAGSSPVSYYASNTTNTTNANPTNPEKDSATVKVPDLKSDRDVYYLMCGR